jgi:hypothetical protein
MRTARIVLAWAVAAVTMVASVTGLWHVASDVAQMGVLGSVAIVAGFDVTAIIAGMRVVEHPRRWSAWALLAAMAAASAAAQIVAAPETLGWWRLLHGAPPVAAIWTLHGAVAEGRTEEKGKKKSKKGSGARRNAAASAPSAAAPAPPSVARLDDARRRGARRSTGTDAPRLSPADTERVRRAADALLAEGVPATRRDIERVLGVGNRVAGRLLPEVKAAMVERKKANSGS